MKKLLVLLIALSFSIVISCGGSGDETKEVKKVEKQEVEKLVASPEEVALNFINAYKNKDLNTVRKIAMPALAINFAMKNFDDDQIERMQGWDGKIKEIKYTYGTLGLTAVAYYSDITDPKDGEGMIAVMILDYLNDKWMYGMGGLEDIKKSDFAEYFTTIHATEFVKGNITGTWNCIESSSSFDNSKKDEAYLQKTFLTFNEDGTVIKVENGREITGEYEIERNKIKMRKLKGEGYRGTGTWSIMFYDENSLKVFNQYAKIVYTKASK